MNVSDGQRTPESMDGQRNGQCTPSCSVKPQLSSRATAFSIAAIIGAEESNTGDKTRADVKSCISPLGKSRSYI